MEVIVRTGSPIPPPMEVDSIPEALRKHAEKLTRFNCYGFQLVDADVVKPESPVVKHEAPADVPDALLSEEDKILMKTRQQRELAMWMYKKYDRLVFWFQCDFYWDEMVGEGTIQCLEMHLDQMARKYEKQLKEVEDELPRIRMRVQMQCVTPNVKMGDVLFSDEFGDFKVGQSLLSPHFEFTSPPACTCDVCTSKPPSDPKKLHEHYMVCFLELLRLYKWMANKIAMKFRHIKSDMRSVFKIGDLVERINDYFASFKEEIKQGWFPFEDPDCFIDLLTMADRSSGNPK